MKNRRILAMLGMVVLALAGTAGGFATGSAKADGTAKVTRTSTQTIMIGHARFNGHQFSAAKITVLADMRIKGVEVSAKNCFWTKPGQKWWNGGYGVNGKQFELDTTPAELCHKGKLLVKVAGGKTGRKCFNEAHLAMPQHVVHGTVMWVGSLANVRVTLRAHEKFHIEAVCGTSDGEALAQVTLTLKVAFRAHGAAISRFFASVTGKAWADAHGKLDCVPVNLPPPTTTVVTTTSTTTVSTTTVSTTTTQTTTTTPTTTVTVTPPRIRNLTQVQEFYPGGVNPNVCVDTQNVPSGGGTVMFVTAAGTTSAGTFTSGSSQNVPSGNGHVCSTLQAPNSTGNFQYYAKLLVGGVEVDQTDPMWADVIAAPANPS